MSVFSEAALEKKLAELSNSQQSVQTLALWLIHHRKHSRNVVAVWYKELRKGEQFDDAFAEVSPVVQSKIDRVTICREIRDLNNYHSFRRNWCIITVSLYSEVKPGVSVLIFMMYS